MNLPPHTEVTDPKSPEECYPKVQVHTWNEFAALAIEYGGYGDVTAIDPYTGRRFWYGNDVTRDNPYDTFRTLIDKMQEERFLG